MNEFDDAQITMVYDPENGETIAKELQCVAAKSLEELVTSPEVDCVIVATPNYLHKEPVILAAKNKKHVLPVFRFYNEEDVYSIVRQARIFCFAVVPFLILVGSIYFFIMRRLKNNATT